MLVRVNLLDPWQPISTATHQGERITIYRWGSGITRCFLICRNGLRRSHVLRRIVEAELEEDTGGMVVTIVKLSEAAQAQPLSNALATFRRQNS